MHIVNIMFSTGSGGIEQAFVDYTEGLVKRGHKVTPITHGAGTVNKQLKAIGVSTVSIRNAGEWDLLAKIRLRLKLRKLKPDVVIAHTGRSFALAKFAVKGHFPLVGVVHNYNDRVARMVAADGVFAITRDIGRFAKSLNIAEDRVYLIPNMVRCDTLPQHTPRNTPPVIGAMGRFVQKKGFDVYIEALRILKERGYQFKAILGGDGQEAKALKNFIKEADLKDMISLPGWVEDKKAFYSAIDIFCLPSLHEPFGIVLLEAFTYGTPVIATDSEGPRDIITPNFDAMLVKKESASELAAAIARLLDDPALAASLALNGFIKARTNYSIESVAERIEKALENIITRYMQDHHL